MPDIAQFTQLSGSGLDLSRGSVLALKRYRYLVWGEYRLLWGDYALAWGEAQLLAQPTTLTDNGLSLTRATTLT